MTRRRELLALLGLIVVAALLRLPGLAARGTWDGDQGHDMLVLRTLVHDGVLPLLGPPTSIGDVHHGAWYYYLLSPAAFLTGGDSPLAVVFEIALAGIAAVAVVWWLARSIDGPAAGLAAALVIAVSAAAVDESTFIWNPNLIALSSGIALLGAWKGWAGGAPGWWIVAAIGTAITMQSHVLGVALLPIIGIPFVIDARRRSLGREAVAWIVVFALAYLPLVVHELTTDFSEVHAALDYLAGGREASTTVLPVRFGIIGLRVISWPLTGLITGGFIPAVIATCAVIAIVALLWRRRPVGDSDGGPGDAGGAAARWYGTGLLWSIAFLTVAAPSLAVVIPGLPNDHYHAFADPIVFTLVGIGVAVAIRPGISRPAGVLAVIGIVALAGWNLVNQPPSPHPDGGAPAGLAAGQRIDAALTEAGVDRASTVLVRSLPDFKSTEAVVYPLAVVGRSYVGETPKGVAPGSVVLGDGDVASLAGLVLLCDDAFAEAIGDHCGGPAESIVAGAGGADWGPLIDRFEAAPGRFVSVYAAAAT
jgi:Dolichyl-phosphate-mannose-protein mannosyltransferase